MWIPVTILTVLLVVAVRLAWGYWHQSDTFRRTQQSWRTFIHKRWLRECIPRLLPSGCLVGAVFVFSAWCMTIGVALPETFWKDALMTAFLAGLVLTALLMAVVQPLVLFFNVPSFLVAPHDRGKPGGLELRRRYREG